MEQHLSPDCQAGQAGYCRESYCPHVAKQAPSGRWYITQGHAGFNSPANNAQGYRTQGTAQAVRLRYALRGSK